MRLNKSIKIFINYFLGPLLFIWLTLSIYRQIINQPHLEQSWQHIQASLTSSKIFLLAGVILLMLANWSIEAVKWKLSVSAIHPVGFVQSFKAILSGVSFSVTLPNRIGEYAGRLLFLPDGKRLKAVANTVGGSISQLLVTLLSGLAGGIIGLGLSLLGLWAVRQQPSSYAELAHLDVGMLLLTFVLAIVASLLAGLLPAWRAMQVAPAIQLKSQ